MTPETPQEETFAYFQALNRHREQARIRAWHDEVATQGRKRAHTPSTPGHRVTLAMVLILPLLPVTVLAQTPAPVLILPDGGTRPVVLEAHEVSRAEIDTDGGTVSLPAGVWLSNDTAEYQARKIVEHENEPAWTPWWVTLALGVVSIAVGGAVTYCTTAAPAGAFCSVKR